jgi:DNA-binding MarR family transcriptional regulator
VICFKEGHIKKMQSLAPIAKAKRSDALAIWHRVTLETVLSNGPDLSSRQLSVLMTIYLDNTNQTVKSRALDTLTKYGFVKRAPDPRDRRSIIVMRTSGGILYLQHFADIIQSEIKSNNFSSAAA